MAMHSPELQRSEGQSEKGGKLAPNKSPDRGEIAISLITTESSLMAQSNSLLSRKNSLFERRREFTDTALKLLCYLARMPRLRALMDRNFPVWQRAWSDWIGLAVPG